MRSPTNVLKSISIYLELLPLALSITVSVAMTTVRRWSFLIFSTCFSVFPFGLALLTPISICKVLQLCSMHYGNRGRRDR